MYMYLQVLRLDITPMAPPTSSTHSPSSAQHVVFSPSAMDQLVVVMSSLLSGESSSAGLAKFSASTGQLLSEVEQCMMYGLRHLPCLELLCVDLCMYIYMCIRDLNSAS